jgi:hypothetical protein
MIVVEAGHAHVMKFLLLSCELSIFVAVTVIFLGEKCGDEFYFFFLLTIEFGPNLTPVCERCVLTYSHNFDVFYMERQP